MIAQATLPDERTAARIFGTHLADEVSRVTRFPTGLCHYVFEVVTTKDTAYVVRIASREFATLHGWRAVLASDSQSGWRTGSSASCERC